MIAQYGDERVVITGSSTHSERIECLWRDVFRCVGKLFYDVFYALEREEVLDPLNETDIYCLHYVFVARISVYMALWKVGITTKYLLNTILHPISCLLLGLLKDAPQVSWI